MDHSTGSPSNDSTPQYAKKNSSHLGQLQAGRRPGRGGGRVRGQGSGVRGQESGVRGQEAKGEDEGARHVGARCARCGGPWMGGGAVRKKQGPGEACMVWGAMLKGERVKAIWDLGSLVAVANTWDWWQ